MGTPPIASLDLGTNTFRLLIAEPAPSRAGENPPAPVESHHAHPSRSAHHTPQTLHHSRVITRAGGGFTPAQGIGAEARERILSCLDGFRQSMAEFGVERYRATATSVFRRAANSPELLREIRRRCGLEVEVIAGEEEAALSALGAVAGMDLAQPVVVFDIGGGSTEYILWEDGRVVFSRSLEFGVVHLAEELLAAEQLTDSDIQRARTRVAGDVTSVAAEITAKLDGRPFILIGTAGTASTLASVDLGLPAYDRSRIHGHKVLRSSVEHSFQRFAALPRAQRSAVPGMEQGRADIIVPGCLITLLTLDAFGSANLIVSEGGLLEGVLYNLILAPGAATFTELNSNG